MYIRKLLWLFLLFCNSSLFAFYAKTSLSGKIIDANTNEPLPGVSIYIPDLKTGTQSNHDGYYHIENLPSKVILVQLSMTGYQTMMENIDLSVTTTKDFKMTVSIKEIHDIVITGMSKASERKRTPVSIASISHLSLLQNSSNNIIDAITTLAGVSQVTTGAGISKPVIRGLGYNRVVVVKDGIRQEGQQWGDEHGIEIDENTVNKVEILKGPASLAFGSDAMAGVINMISYPTLQEGKIAALINTNFQSNQGLLSYSGSLAGNLRGFIWDIRLSNKWAHAYKNKYDHYVYNSGFIEKNIEAVTGFNKSWGYSHLTFSRYQLKPGIIDGERDSASGNFIKEIMINDSLSGSVLTNQNDDKRYGSQIPYQSINHNKLVWNNALNLQGGSLKVVLAMQQNKRKEYDNIFTPAEYGLYFLLNTFHYDIRYVLPEIKTWNLSIGIAGMKQHSQNKGTAFLIPSYRLNDLGAFVIAKKTIKQLDFSGGIRYDLRSQHGDELILDKEGKPSLIDSTGFEHKFNAFHALFQGVSGSLGFAYQISTKAFVKLNFSRGFRAPNIGELSSNGIHEGTSQYLLGDSKLLPENSMELDAVFGINTPHLTLELDVFNNRIQHYIYQHKLLNQFGNDSMMNGFQVFKYVQGNANLFGGELMVDIHPHPFDFIHFQNAFSFVKGTQNSQPDSLRNLPLMPPAKWRSELKLEQSSLGKYLQQVYFKTELEYYFAQHKYFKAYGTETATPAYMLLHAGIGANIVQHKKTLCSLFINVNNLTDKAYQSHLSRLKYTDQNVVTDRRGIYNMGRNYSLKMVIPIQLKEKK